MVDVVSINPADGTEIFRRPEADAAAVDAAVTAAVRAQPLWAELPASDRAAVLERFADRLTTYRGEIAGMVTREVGKLTNEAHDEVDWTALSARWYATHPPAGTVVDGVRVRRRPLGVVAAITPWNVPLVTPAWKWLPAMMAGNAVVWKPSELATATALRAADLFRAAGLPDGVLSVVPGPGDVAAMLCRHREVRCIHFTGSTRTGTTVAELASRRSVRCALEMGGVNVAVVFPDADLDTAADAIIASATAIAGQKCTSTRRVIAHQKVVEPLVDRLARRIDGLVPGDPSDPLTTLAPLISPAARRHADQAVIAAAGRGCRVVARSLRLGTDDGASAHFRATLLTEVPRGDPLERDELFAPVLGVQAFVDAEDAWQLARASSYGLSAAVYTRDTELAALAADRIDTGVLAVNGRSDAVGLTAPFAGRGRSGNGQPEGGSYAYGPLTDLQAIYDHSSGT